VPDALRVSLESAADAVSVDRIAFRFGTQQLNVQGPGLDLGPLVAGKPIEPGGSDLCCVWPGPVGDLLRRLAAHGVAVEDGPVTRHGGRGAGTSVYFRDPDGSLREFICYRTEPAPRQ
jgi:catechol 2,3-dioxygenase-like lactoylglutathione lyase family enzyme